MAHTLQFPDGFHWGAATAAHQIEGNNINSDWWPREHAAGTSIVEPSGDAADSYHRYAEDMRLLKDAGLDTYRFSIEWARIEPEKGFVSRAEIDHYRRMVDTALELGITPMVTLMHFTVPRWFADEGMWRAADATDRFARYVETALPVLGDDVHWVCTINEPNIAAMIAGGEDPANLVAYGLPAPDLAVADTLLDCHHRAQEILSGVGGIRSGWTIATQAFQAEPGCEDVKHAYGYPRDDWYLEMSRGDDWVGVQAYTRTIIGPDGPRQVPDGVETTLTGWEYYPPAMAEASAPPGSSPAASRCSSPRTASPPATTPAGSTTPRPPWPSCTPRSRTASPSRATCTGPCWTTTNGPPATGRPSG